jgi:hypothetical protein
VCPAPYEAILDDHYLGRGLRLAEAAVLKLEKRTKPQTVANCG